MESDPSESSSVRHEANDRAYDHLKNERSTRTFFALLSFFMAIILLSVFLNAPLDGFSKMLVLAGTIILSMLGIIMLERRRVLQQMLISSMGKADDEEEEIDKEALAEAQSLTPFELLIQEALDSIPIEFQERMENLIVLVEDQPGEETLERVGTKEGATLLGLYQGAPLTAQGYQKPLLPERITIYQHPIEAYCQGNPRCIREQVRNTLLHEVAHHFGIDHEEMPIWLR